MGNKKMYVDILFKYAGLFEEVFDQGEDIMEPDNWEDYEEVIKELNKITGRHDRNTYLETIQKKRNHELI